jgi:hypothetical protein
MNILFTFENQVSLERSLYLINWLVYKQHVVYVVYIGTLLEYISARCLVPIDNTTSDFSIYDVWFYSPECDSNLNVKSKFLNELYNFEGQLIMLSMDDGIDFYSHKITPEILNKTKYYLGNVWYKDKTYFYGIWDSDHNMHISLNEEHQAKFRLLPSFHESSNFIECDQVPTIPFNSKCNFVTFVGGINGNVPGQDVRVNTINKIIRLTMITDVFKLNMKIIGHTGDPINTYYYNERVLDSVKSSRISFESYIKEINVGKFSLCPKGNSPHVTYRFYESLRYQTLVFMNEISNDVEFYNPPIPHKHYVPYDIYCSNLMPSIKYYINNIKEAEEIALNGYEYWKHFKFDTNGKVSDELDQYLSNLFQF